jgi:DNA-binding XRE family transcriptional regulator
MMAKPAKRKTAKATPAESRRSAMFHDADDMAPRIGRPRFAPTEKDRAYVRKMASVGLTHEEIAGTIGVDRTTLVKYFRQDIDDGRIEANALVAASLFRKATDKSVTGASVRAAEIWLRVRASWVDAVHPKERDDETGDNQVVVTGGLPERGAKELPIDDGSPAPNREGEKR